MDAEKPFHFIGKLSQHKAAKHPESSPFSREKESGKDPEVEQMIKKMQKMHDEIEVKLDDIYQRSGLDPRSVKDFLDNPNNFNSKDWERIQGQRQLFLEQVGVPASKAPKVLTAQQEMDKTAKERKSKTLGARRNWIPM